MSAVGKVEVTALTWTAADADRLAVMRRLRGNGFTENMLREDTPAYSVLSRRPAEQWPQVLEDWHHLGPWRQAAPWFEVGLRASRG